MAAIRAVQVAIVLALCGSGAVLAQYDGRQQYGTANHYGGYGDSPEYGRAGYDSGNYGGYGGGGSGYGSGYGNDYEDRPKINLGFKVKIPAMKFELPRFSLPKITVSARIRKPNKPKTITLPEINLDTSSGNGNKHQQQNPIYGNAYHQQQSSHSYDSGGNSYGDHAIIKDAYSSSPSQTSSYSSSAYSYSPSSSSYSPSYAGASGYRQPASGPAQKETSYSFSAHEDDSYASQGYSKAAAPNYYGQGASKYAQHHQQQQPPQQQPLASSAYKATPNFHPSYLSNSKRVAAGSLVSGVAAPASAAFASSPSFNANSQQYITSQQLSDAGFNVPVYDEPSGEQNSYSFGGKGAQYNSAKIGANSNTNTNSQSYQQQVSL